MLFLKNNFVTKLTNWEYWPSYMFYIPNIPYAFFLAVKAKSITFFTNVNPAMNGSGNGTESKYQTLLLIPEKYRPKSILVKPFSNFREVTKKITNQNITYPLIVKPDIGFRGLLVKKIINENELKKHLIKYPINIIIQEFINYENECGIFYVRKPNEKNGLITSITTKKFISVIGNGKSTLRKLITNHKRGRLYLNIFEKIHKDDINSIPKKDEKIILTAIGNHSKGTEFIDSNHLINDKLTNIFNQISYDITGWFYGRLDIKYNSFNKIEDDLNFKILEINGIISEPTNIYDKKSFTYFKALKSIRKHWKILFEIHQINKKEYNIKTSNFKTFITDVLFLRGYTKKIKRLID